MASLSTLLPRRLGAGLALTALAASSGSVLLAAQAQAQATKQQLILLVSYAVT